MGKYDREQGNGNCREASAGESGNWFAVFGDIDDFIFYDGNMLTDDEEPRSTR